MAGKRKQSNGAKPAEARPQSEEQSKANAPAAQSDDLALPGFLSIFQEMVTPGSSSAGSKVVVGALVALFCLLPLLYFSGFPLIHIGFISFLSLGLFASFIWFMSELNKEKARSALESTEAVSDSKKTQ